MLANRLHAVWLPVNQAANRQLPGSVRAKLGVFFLVFALRVLHWNP